VILPKDYNPVIYMCSEFGQFYENLIVSGNQYGVPIKRKRTEYTNGFLTLAKAYFHHKKNSAGFAILVGVVCLNYLHIPNYLKLNIAAIFIGVLMLSFYVNALYRKRMNNGNLVFDATRSKT